jgi:hypothetical protein
VTLSRFAQAILGLYVDHPPGAHYSDESLTMYVHMHAPPAGPADQNEKKAGKPAFFSYSSDQLTWEQGQQGLRPGIGNRQ